MKKRLGLVGGVVVVGAAAWFLISRLRSHWDEVGPALADAPRGLVIAAVLCAAASMTALAVAWRVILVMLGERPKSSDVIAWYFAGEIGKYLPGGVWQFVGRGELAARNGVSRAAAYLSVAMALLQLLGSGALFVSLIGPWALEAAHPVIRYGSLAITPVLVICLHPKVLGAVSGVAARLTKGRLELPALSWSQAITVISAGLPAWVLIGATHALLAHALGIDVSDLRVFGAAAVAWIVGLLVIVAPAGLGVREVVFVAIAGLSDGYGAAVTTAARLCFVVVDGVGAAVALAWLARRRVGTGQHDEAVGD